jgi:lipopolysaccharide transport system permease protein
MKILSGPLAVISRHRGILTRTTLTEIRGTYAGSMLGMLWVFAGPMLLLTIYALVFAVIFRVRPVNMTVAEYVLYVFSGLVPFLAFANALTVGALSLSSNKQLLLNTVFPAELIPLRSVLVASVGLPAGTIILLLGDAVFSTLSWTWFLLPVVLLFQVMFVTGICWMLSLLALLVRDIQHILMYVTMTLLVVTPIAYTPDMIPATLLVLMYGNPLFYFVTCYQSLVILNSVPPPVIVAITVGLSVGTFWLGYTVCHRAKQVFYDYA